MLSAENAVTEMQKQRYQSLLEWRNIAKENFEILEYNLLQSTMQGDSITDIIKSLHVVDLQISEIEESYNELRVKQKQHIKNSYQPKFDALNDLEPEMWETDREFEQRIQGLRNEIQTELDGKLAHMETELSTEQQEEKQPYIQLQQTGLKNLSEERTVSSEFISISPQEYQRNERKWAFLLTSSHPFVQFEDFEVVVDFNELLGKPTVTIEDIRQFVISLDEAVRTDNITFDVIWSMTREDERYLAEVSSIVGTNLIDGNSHQFQYPKPLIASAYYVEGTNLENAEIIPTSPIMDINLPSIIKVKPSYTIELSIEVFPSNVLDKTLLFFIEDTSLAEIDDTGIITTSELSGETELIVISKDGLFSQQYPLTVAYSIQDVGPAGGFIFYVDEDNEFDWTYLEAAPEDIRSNSSWGDTAKYDNIQVETRPTIGSGLQNTLDIAQYINSANNAPQLCLDYELNGFDDWFLPSMGELNVLLRALNTTNLNNRRKFNIEGITYWTSSSRGRGSSRRTVAWKQSTRDLKQEEFEIYHTTPAIRPIRAF